MQASLTRLPHPDQSLVRFEVPKSQTLYNNLFSQFVYNLAHPGENQYNGASFFILEVV